MMFFSFAKTRTNSKLKRKHFFVLIVLSTMLAVFLQGCGSFPSNFEPSSPGTSKPATSGSSVEPTPENQAAFSYDVVIYGGTPSGVMAAMAASREGLKVAILEPSKHIGGMISGGLCESDIGNIKVIGGLAREFFVRAGNYYNQGISPVYSIEPHLAEELFLQCVDEVGVDVYYGYRLKETGGVQKSGATIKTVTMDNNIDFSAKVFIDCTYEGDLMAKAGVSYTVGREERNEFDETLAGRRPFSYTNNFRYDLSARSINGGLVTGISNEAVADVGQGDKKLPSYNFRLCITDDPTNQVPFGRPSGYDPSQYDLVLQWLLQLKQYEGNRGLNFTDVFYLGTLPGNKRDMNNFGPFSSDYVGHSWGYPEANYKTRGEILNQHKEYLQGLLFFLGNDQRVPAELREDVNGWGLAKDEHADNGNWPYQLYIREARRMVGDFVMTQKDLQTDLEKYDSIGMASYPIDSHHVQRVVNKDGFVQNEGEIQIPVNPYQLPYRILLPKKSEADNLLVPVCVSASHIAYSSIRMEPQYMILGQAAGVAAKLAIEQNCNVQEIDIHTLRTLLERQGAILKMP